MNINKMLLFGPDRYTAQKSSTNMQKNKTKTLRELNDAENNVFLKLKE